MRDFPMYVTPARILHALFVLIAGLLIQSYLDPARAYNAPPVDTRYNVSEKELNGPPGTIVRIWAPPVGWDVPGMHSFRILYRSRGLKGEPIAVSGAIFFPHGPAPEGGRRIIAWAHPTTGVATRCAPTLVQNLRLTVEGMAEMAREGYVVVATDYPGLGAPGTHPYLISESEGRALLDSVRAARKVPNSGAGDKFALWGHSQGGHAVLAAGHIAASYAPELDLVGIAAAAPATDLIALFDADRNTSSGAYLSSLALWSWSRIFNQPLSKTVQESTMRAFEETATDCIQDLSEFLMERRADKVLRDGFMKVNPTKAEPWRSIMSRNSPGPTPRRIPIFIAQGTADTTVSPRITYAYVRKLCRHGSSVLFKEMEGVQHIYAARHSSRAAVAWMGARFRGERAPNDCARIR
ncbi:MAG: lipase family protein [Hyphomicrobiaceae bacterium]|nr:lipase family protein [Hyphomicrobiaceae bacterium]